MRYDGIGIVTDAQTRIAAEAPKLAFYLEVYARGSAPLTGKLVGTVLDAQGKTMARMDLANINSTGARARLAGSVSVAGLSPGQYSLDARIELADTAFTRSAKFVMDAPATVAAGASATSPYFASLSDAELAQLFDPLVVWLQTRQERNLYSGLTPTGRRQFLARYFGTSGPTGNPDSRLDMYLERVKRVNERFTERTGRLTQGWQTDRGRVYLLRGDPANQIKRPFAPNDAPPYEIWSYNIGQQFVYVFIDESRLGHYRMVFSTDPGEVSLPDWQNRVGPSVIDDLRTQFNIKI
jgi:GWxTD domain-containing protein